MNAIALVESENHVCSRYRIRAFLPALRLAGCDLRVQGLERGPTRRLSQLSRVSQWETVLLQRKLLPTWQLRLLRKRANRLVFDFDDAVLYRDSYDSRGPHCSRRLKRFQATVRQADLVIAGNAFLAECAVHAGASPNRVRVIPTCVDVNELGPRGLASQYPGLDLVWIGSSSTLSGLEQRSELLTRLAREVLGCRLRLISDRFARFDPLLVEDVTWSHEREACELARSDAGISMVPDDLWSRGKCGLKVLQYQATGLPVVADRVGVHSEMVRDGVDGFLPRNDDQWIQAIHALALDPHQRRQMGSAARERVVRNYSVEAWEPAFVEALTGVGMSVAAASRGPHSLAMIEAKPTLRPPSSWASRAVL